MSGGEEVEHVVEAALCPTACTSEGLSSPETLGALGNGKREIRLGSAPGREWVHVPIKKATFAVPAEGGLDWKQSSKTAARRSDRARGIVGGFLMSPRAVA
jgi:hypothetical protein